MAYREDYEAGDGQNQDDAGDAAAEAFEAVRAEVALLRRAVQQLAAERADVPTPPDYSETLGAIIAEVEATAGQVEAIARSPMLATTHAQVAGALAQVSEKVRHDGMNTAAHAARTMDEATRQLREVTASAREARTQNWMLAGAVAIGAMLWFGAQGFVLRAAPDSWAWPERVAAMTVGAPMWEAGQRIMAAAAPADFDRVAAADRLYQANAKAIEACRRKVAKLKRDMECRVKVR